MGQGSITQIGYQPAQIGAVLEALQAAKAYYGIDTEKAQQKLLGEKLKTEQMANARTVDQEDPTSVTAKTAQFMTSAALKAYEKEGIPLPDSSKLSEMISGSPAKTVSTYPGYPGPAGQEEVAATPGMSAAQLKAVAGEESPLGKFAGQKMAARAAENRLVFRDGQIDKRQEFQENKNAIGIANKDAELVTAQNRLNGAGRMLDIADKVQSGKLKGTNQIMNSLANEYAKLESGSNSAGLGQSERATMQKTVQGDWNDLVTRFTGKINDQGTISPDQMKQLRGEIDAMANSYMTQFDQRHHSLREGFMYPNSQETLDKKVESIRDSFKKRFGHWGEQSGGDSPAASSGGGMPNDLIGAAQAEIARRRGGAK